MTLEISHSFPPDIIREILLKVSTVKSLLRCKSVCKEWYTLISDQHFIKSHYTLSTTNNINYAHHRLIYKQDNDLISCPLYDVLFHNSANHTLLLEIPFQQTRGFRIIGSCNGLMCLFGVDDNTLFIYNPSTRATNILPPSKQGADWYVFSGFGYDETTHDYKVVKLWRCWPYWGTVIYSLKAGSWKEIGRFPLVKLFNDGKFLNGALHWETGDYYMWHIVSLDLGKETYGEVLPPEYDVEVDMMSHLGVLGESLCVLYNYIKSHVVDVWVMKVYGVKDSWTKLASIPDIWWDRDLILDPLCISKDGKVLLRLGPQLLVYDSKNSSSTIIDNFNRCHQACIVVESLVSPFPPLGLADINDDENQGFDDDHDANGIVSFKNPLKKESAGEKL
ncbi:F-box associated interaction domain-containing protein [Artemisia annua]|uniref:F-box associated interaction domain-containing protein n=1 Tax=Artemisia annua TaxID=35608 RepID=A0A2U1PT19_ARTAN|nr:F-box associated interaction domain-containing protein [Artemisia annua]